jgi:Tfp pilus assembly protein FimT
MTHINNVERATVRAEKRPTKSKQRGIYLIEFLFVLALAVIAGFLAYRQFGGSSIKTTVPTIADDIKAFVLSQQALVQGSSSLTPYQKLTQADFATAMKDSKLQVGDGADNTGENVRHRLGGDTGLVTVVNPGATFGLDFVKVNRAACPEFISSIQAGALNVTVNGTAVKTVDENGNVQVAYDAITAQGLCKSGNVNEFVFTFGRS